MVVKKKTVKEPVAVSAILDTGGWKYRLNDQEVDEETYDRLIKEHLEWVKEEETKQSALQAARKLEDKVKPKRKKK